MTSRRAISFHPHNHFRTLLTLGVICAAAMFVLSARCFAQVSPIWDFAHTQGNGYNPYAPLAHYVSVDSHNFYGTTYSGGDLQCRGSHNLGCGEVFQMAGQPHGSYNYSAIYEFEKGCCVTSTLTVDDAGRVYDVDDKVFQLTPPAHMGDNWGFRDIFDFTGPGKGLSWNTPFQVDSNGILYGFSTLGGQGGCGGNGCGEIFELVPPKGMGKYDFKLIHRFSGRSDGGQPTSILRTAHGVIYGTTGLGAIAGTICPSGCGTIFRLEQSGDRSWHYTVLYSFSGVHDGKPYNLVVGTDGALYGLAARGQLNGREVFRLAPAQTPGAWRKTLLHESDPTAYPLTSLIAGPNGLLYGTVFGDINLDAGRIFRLTPPSSGDKWTYDVIWDFNRSGPDRNPNGITLRGDGVLFGTLEGGNTDGGAVFEFYPPQ